MFMHLESCTLSKVQCPANGCSLSKLVIDIDPSTEPFVDGLIPEFYHTTAVPYSKPPEEAVRHNLRIFIDEESIYPSV